MVDLLYVSMRIVCGELKLLIWARGYPSVEKYAQFYLQNQFTIHIRTARTSA